MSEIFEVIFGTYTWVQLFGFAWFIMIGYIIYGLNETSSRDKLGTKTPKKWKWRFWLKDNWRRYLAKYYQHMFYLDSILNLLDTNLLISKP